MLIKHPVQRTSQFDQTYNQNQIVKGFIVALDHHLV